MSQKIVIFVPKFKIIEKYDIVDSVDIHFGICAFGYYTSYQRKQGCYRHVYGHCGMGLVYMLWYRFRYESASKRVF